MKELFANRAWATLGVGMNASQLTMQLTAGHGERIGVIPAGSFMRIDLLNSASNVSETVFATNVNADTVTILRGQDDTLPVIHLAGDRLEARIGKSTMDGLSQKGTTGTDALQEIHVTTAKNAPLADTDEIPLIDSEAVVPYSPARVTIGELAKTIFAPGTRLLFQQSTAPTGWVKDTTHNDKALRIVSGNASSGGNIAFTSAFASRTPAGSANSAGSGSTGSTAAIIDSAAAGGTVAGHTLTTAEIPAHSHDESIYSYSDGGIPRVAPTTQGSDSVLRSTSSVGGGDPHSHGFSGASHAHNSSAHSHTVANHGHSLSMDAMNFAVNYVDAIICSKEA